MTSSPLTILADRLIIRHLRVSVPDLDTRQELLGDLKQEPLLEKNVRCVAVVGAGASAPLLKRADALATELEKELHVSEKALRDELFRLQRVYGLDPGEFETRLAAMSRMPEAAQHVKDVISDKYDYRHPTILGYELLSHLLKHRFLDAIISFNFDELLDQSLDDELGPNGYRRIVSDRDCSRVDFNPDSPEYLPLYIKLHGTATEPDSLRLTREAYYELPGKVMSVVEGLLGSQKAVLVNVGSAMTGFDLHRLLRIPEQLEIYDLSFEALTDAVCEKIDAERKTPLEDSYHADEARANARFFRLADEGLIKGNASSDQWLEKLVEEIDLRSGAKAEEQSVAGLVRFRSVDRHQAIADVLGPENTLSRWTQNKERFRNEYESYLKQRTIVELAFSGAKARGLAQLSWLAVDRCGTYYDLYRQVGDKVDRWHTLRKAGGLAEHKVLPDVAESMLELCEPGAGETFEDGNWALREFVPKVLAEHVITRIGKNESDIERLAKALKGLQEGSEVEVHAANDQVCAKAFDAPQILPTITSLAIYTSKLFDGLNSDDHVYISCETGEWLLEDGAIQDLISRQNHVEILTAFDFKFEELNDRYGKRLKLKRIDPWRHNRHMTVVCQGKVPTQAVYFARRLRTPVITPVYLGKSNDARRVKHTFDLMQSHP